MKKNNNKINKELVVTSSTENLSHIRDFIKSAAEESGFSKEIVGKIVLATDEACTNVIKHAYKYSSKRSILISVKFETPKLIISVTDDGLYFDPDIIPDPDLIKFHKEKKIGGLGMFLMKKLMDEVSYKNLANNKNQVLMVKYLT